MADFFEIDFLDVEAKKSGDAIPLRYSVNGETRLHVTDGGFQDTGEAVIEHIKKYYDAPSHIDAVVGDSSRWRPCRGPQKAFRRLRNWGALDAPSLALC
jgi:hypothetical protein